MAKVTLPGVSKIKIEHLWLKALKLQNYFGKGKRQTRKVEPDVEERKEVITIRSMFSGGD